MKYKEGKLILAMRKRKLDFWLFCESILIEIGSLLHLLETFDACFMSKSDLDKFLRIKIALS